MIRILILCLATVALARLTAARVERDVSLGYQYNQGHSSGGGNLLEAPQGSSAYTPLSSGNSYYPSAASSFGLAGTSGFVPSTQTVALGNAGNGLGNSGSGFSSFTSGGSNSQSYNYEQQGQYAYQNQEPIVTKHFYIHSAPEDHDEQQVVRYINIGRPQKNYRVVFINAPTSSLSKAKIIAKVAPTEEKTAIYVLAKKSNALDVSAEVVTPPPVNNKPEVFFIKYKTPAEAQHAQHLIQAQYDGLGGSSQVSNEGFVPVSSVIGSLGGSADASAISSSSSGSDGNFGSNGIGGIGGASDIGTVQTQNIGSAIHQVITGDNSQPTYLPANQ